jgi:hypothetical protein
MRGGTVMVISAAARLRGSSDDGQAPLAGSFRLRPWHS